MLAQPTMAALMGCWRFRWQLVYMLCHGALPLCHMIDRAQATLAGSKTYGSKTYIYVYYICPFFLFFLVTVLNADG